VGFAFVTSACFGCGQLMSYNPLRVPSIRHPQTRSREPICQSCVERVNPQRIANGLEPIVPLPGAYDPIDERELP
jgi:hypothetical protein